MSFNFGDSDDSEDELPSGWEERTTLDNRVFYANHSTRITQWVHPRTGKRKILIGELPDGWVKIIGAEDRVEYAHEKSGKRTYTDPRLAFAKEEEESSPKNTTKKPSHRQRFDASTKALQVLHNVDLHNKIIVITGANRGVGLETAKALVFHGAHVIMACRDTELADRVRCSIEADHGEANITVMHCDLSKLTSVEEFAQRMKIKFDSIDVLILNAGVFALPYSLTDDGFEMTFQVNYLAQFYLVNCLESLLINAKAGARVVVVSSESHRFAGSMLGSGLMTTRSDHFLCDSNLNPQNKSQYWYMHAYNVSKLCCVLFAFELDRRLHSKDIRVNALHPGNMISTSLARHSWLLRLLFALVRPFTKSLQQAAATSVYVAVAPELAGVGGQYFNNCWFCPPDKASYDTKLQKDLWTYSMKLIEESLERKKLH